MISCKWLDRIAHTQNVLLRNSITMYTVPLRHDDRKKKRTAEMKAKQERENTG